MEGTLQCSLLRGDSAQVFPDFDELRGVVLFSLWWVFQLVQSLLPSQQLLPEGALKPLGLQLLLFLLDQLIPATVLQDPLQFGFTVHTQAPSVIHEQLPV